MCCRCSCRLELVRQACAAARQQRQAEPDSPDQVPARHCLYGYRAPLHLPSPLSALLSKLCVPIQLVPVGCLVVVLRMSTDADCWLNSPRTPARIPH